MSPLFKKLCLGELKEIAVLNAPESFEAELKLLEGVMVHRKLKKAPISFGLAFVQTLAEVEAAAKQLSQMPGDSLVWFAYPKQTSKNYTCEFNRDTGWNVLGELGFEGVRQVAIDADWSALRFRRVEYVKSLTRDVSRALSDQGKSRTKKS